MQNRFLARMACGVALLAACSAAIAQSAKFPSRPIDMIVNFGPGGGADGLGRNVAKLMEPVFGVPVPVANVAGASGNAGLSKVLSSTPDGYTIGTMTGLTIAAWISGLGNMKVSDFAVISVSQSSPSMLFAPQGSKIQSYKQLLEMAKANAGKIRVATAGYGTLDDVAIRYLATKGVPMVNVPFAKPGERYASPLGGHSELLFEEPGVVLPLTAAGALAGIALYWIAPGVDVAAMSRGVIGPTTWPKAMLLAAAACAALLALARLPALLGRAPGSPRGADPMEYHEARSLGAITLLVAYGAAIPLISIALATPLFIAGWLVLRGLRRPL